MYLYGASGHAKVIIDILRDMGIPAIGAFDKNPAIKEVGGIPVLGPEVEQDPEKSVIISIGDNAIRRRVAEQLKLSFGKAIHPTAIISPSVTIAEGTVVMHGAIVQADATIGKHVIVNTGASIDHDCKIGDYAHISPGAVLSGNVQVGEGTHIGAGAVVIPNLKIGKWCKIGAGAVVIRDIPDGVTAVGNPARIIKEHLTNI
ncbi:acetyltransferase [Pontibacter virosus]|uniref:Acetyltransferase EpsM n=1 Tax=Pontibacter virosus TaxID=1765052 RepID=A0A2U1B3A7_9BACT|nr:acetyltransferase [Pontibacter virosus]PVY43017.1 acetyltransferase EpsM [Pontibacter virosus]